MRVENDSQTWPFNIVTEDKYKELVSNVGDTPGARADPATAMSVYEGGYMVRALERETGKTGNLLN
jgi:hypothetical protein